MRNLSNLSNSCLTTSPTDKESGYSEVRSGCRIGVGESKLLASSDYKVWVEHSALDRMLEHVLPIKFAELVERKLLWGTCPESRSPVAEQRRMTVQIWPTPANWVLRPTLPVTALDQDLCRFVHRYGIYWGRSCFGRGMRHWAPPRKL